MGKLDAAERNALPGKDFAGPDRSYPDQDRAHQINGKARAKQMLNKGHISQAEYDKICANIDRKMAK
jgi:hypothetical protein